MKIFKINTILLSATFGFLALGCTNLDETVYSDIVAEETTFTANDLNAIIAPPYTKFRDIYWGWDGLFDLYEESSDVIVTPNRLGIGWGAYYIDMHKHTWAPGLSHTEALWDRAYTAINTTNKAIFQIEGLGEAEGADAYIAELKALRAMYYYLLYDNFRRVPIVTQFDVEAGFIPEQSTSQQVYDFIIKELTDAIPLLTEERNQSTYGRVTKWAAKMTLAKMYLNSEVYIGTPRWDDALSEVQDVIDSDKFSLTPNFSDVFAIENENLSETIFAIPFDQVYAGGSYVAWKALFGASKETFDLSGSPWGGSAAIPQFIDTYDVDDQRLEDTWLGGPQLTSSGEPLLIDKDNPSSQLDYVNYISSVDGAEFNEGNRFVRYEIGRGDIMTNSNDVPFYRYTDALMIKAECLLRTDDAPAAAIIVSNIRARSFKDNPAKATVTSAQLMGGSVYQYGPYENGVITNLQGGGDIQYGGFLDNLGWEFVGEHHRKQDLIRFGVYTTKSWLSHVPNGVNRKVFPIPESQLLANPKLTQNDYQ
ncbi:RagB/SusD family nutrient uptake outer membrane protein [Mariniflexile litorale]|uniref:RagB/SusD family nutrient uptake outer membrane protein n=1 Tax=Mariniflexile litorale TaxID=3045158 RepID=A0AAU7EER1_9FLAO|nr:RagB/SusD family nutrient uptake outer membrane protein [Mariniflexile sp. KMM 9835]MDQ8212864.1 RagB/SusD family nutrient uptake outer membrane protein [Mariniflexile sp. KMM 9835]